MNTRRLWVLGVMVNVMGVSIANVCIAQSAADLGVGRVPDAFAVRFNTTKGAFVVEAYRDWAPNAVDRFYTLVQEGYFDGNVFYWVSRDSNVRFGAHADAETGERWRAQAIEWDAPRMRVTHGHIYMHPFDPGAFGIFLGDSDDSLTEYGVAPFGRVVEESPAESAASSSGVLQSLDDSHMRKRNLKFYRSIVNLFDDGDEKFRNKYEDLDSIESATILDQTVTVPESEFSRRDTGESQALDGEGVLVIYRPDDPKANRGMKKRLFELQIDGEPYAVLDASTRVEVALPAGAHELTAREKTKGLRAMGAVLSGNIVQVSRQRATLYVNVDSGNVYYIRGVADISATDTTDSLFQLNGDGGFLDFYRVVDDFGAAESAGLSEAESARD